DLSNLILKSNFKENNPETTEMQVEDKAASSTVESESLLSETVFQQSNRDEMQSSYFQNLKQQTLPSDSFIICSTNTTTTISYMESSIRPGNERFSPSIESGFEI